MSRTKKEQHPTLIDFGDQDLTLRQLPAPEKKYVERDALKTKSFELLDIIRKEIGALYIASGMALFLKDLAAQGSGHAEWAKEYLTPLPSNDTLAIKQLSDSLQTAVKASQELLNPTLSQLDTLNIVQAAHTIRDATLKDWRALATPIERLQALREGITQHLVFSPQRFDQLVTHVQRLRAAVENELQQQTSLEWSRIALWFDGAFASMDKLLSTPPTTAEKASPLEEITLPEPARDPLSRILGILEKAGLPLILAEEKWPPHSLKRIAIVLLYGFTKDHTAPDSDLPPRNSTAIHQHIEHVQPRSSDKPPEERVEKAQVQKILMKLSELKILLKEQKKYQLALPLPAPYTALAEMFNSAQSFAASMAEQEFKNAANRLRENLLSCEKGPIVAGINTLLKDLEYHRAYIASKNGKLPSSATSQFSEFYPCIVNHSTIRGRGLASHLTLKKLDTASIARVTFEEIVRPKILEALQPLTDAIDNHALALARFRRDAVVPPQLIDLRNMMKALSRCDDLTASSHLKAIKERAPSMLEFIPSSGPISASSLEGTSDETNSTSPLPEPSVIIEESTGLASSLQPQPSALAALNRTLLAHRETHRIASLLAHHLEITHDDLRINVRDLKHKRALSLELPADTNVDTQQVEHLQILLQKSIHPLCKVKLLYNPEGTRSLRGRLTVFFPPMEDEAFFDLPYQREGGLADTLALRATLGIALLTDPPLPPLAAENDRSDLLTEELSRLRLDGHIEHFTITKQGSQFVVTIATDTARITQQWSSNLATRALALGAVLPIAVVPHLDTTMRVLDETLGTSRCWDVQEIGDDTTLCIRVDRDIDAATLRRISNRLGIPVRQEILHLDLNFTTINSTSMPISRDNTLTLPSWLPHKEIVHRGNMIIVSCELPPLDEEEVTLLQRRTALPFGKVLLLHHIQHLEVLPQRSCIEAMQALVEGVPEIHFDGCDVVDTPRAFVTIYTRNAPSQVREPEYEACKKLCKKLGQLHGIGVTFVNRFTREDVVVALLNAKLPAPWWSVEYDKERDETIVTITQGSGVADTEVSRYLAESGVSSYIKTSSAFSTPPLLQSGGDPRSLVPASARELDDLLARLERDLAPSGVFLPPRCAGGYIEVHYTTPGITQPHLDRLREDTSYSPLPILFVQAKEPHRIPDDDNTLRELIKRSLPESTFLHQIGNDSSMTELSIEVFSKTKVSEKLLSSELSRAFGLKVSVSHTWLPASYRAFLHHQDKFTIPFYLEHVSEHGFIRKPVDISQFQPPKRAIQHKKREALPSTPYLLSLDTEGTRLVEDLIGARFLVSSEVFPNIEISVAFTDPTELIPYGSREFRDVYGDVYERSCKLYLDGFSVHMIDPDVARKGSFDQGAARPAILLQRVVTYYGYPLPEEALISSQIVTSSAAETFGNADWLLKQRVQDCPKTAQLLALRQAAPRRQPPIAADQILYYHIGETNRELAKFVLAQGVPLIGANPSSGPLVPQTSLIRTLAERRGMDISFNGAFRDGTRFLNMYALRTALGIRSGEVSQRQKEEFSSFLAQHVENYNKRLSQSNQRALALQKIVKIRNAAAQISPTVPVLAQLKGLSDNVATLHYTPRRSSVRYEVRADVPSSQKALKPGDLLLVYLEAFVPQDNYFSARFH